MYQISADMSQWHRATHEKYILYSSGCQAECIYIYIYYINIYRKKPFRSVATAKRHAFIIIENHAHFIESRNATSNFKNHENAKNSLESETCMTKRTAINALGKMDKWKQCFVRHSRFTKERNKFREGANSSPNRCMFRND